MIAKSSVILNKIGRTSERTSEILGERTDIEVGIDNRLQSFGHNVLASANDKLSKEVENFNKYMTAVWIVSRDHI